MSIEFKYYEQFVFESDRSKFLKTLIPASDSFYFFTLLDAMNTHGALLPEEMLAWIKKGQKKGKNG
jgi:hypothetical protein